MASPPKDWAGRRIGAEARKLVHSAFSTERWEYHEETGQDVGRDCTIELVENDEWTNKKIEGQIKGTTIAKTVNNGRAYSFSIELKTIKYALGSSSAFVLFFVPIETGKVYYLPIQDYFIADPALFEKLEGNQKTLNVHIPIENIVSEDDYDLQQIAKSVYVGGPARDLHKVS